MPATKSQRKPLAADRTVDMFSGKTKLEEIEAALEDVQETPRGSETIEEAAERWRANAFYCQQLFSKHYADNLPETGKFRLTRLKEWWLLEQMRLGKDGMAYHWTGVMFRDSDMYELTNVLVQASREKKERDNCGES